jgi:hypothetical protein
VITQGFSKEYKLTVDASDVGVCAVFFPEGKDDIDLPNCYFFLKHFHKAIFISKGTPHGVSKNKFKGIKPRDS